MLYLYHQQGTQQPGEPKAPDTENHIPVSEQRSNTNSQEDSFGAVKALKIERSSHHDRKND